MANLLSIQADAKTRKGDKLGVLTGILYLQPSTAGGHGNLCPFASPGCIASCLNTAGRGIMTSVQAGRQRKTDLLFQDRAAFYAQLERDIRALVRKAERLGMTPAVRLNGTSDLPWETMRNPSTGRTILETFPNVQFYDYTKNARRAIAWAKGYLPQNYDLTFSRSETNEREACSVLAYGGRVAIVFRTIPQEHAGFPCVDGDVSDVRFQDPRGVVVALKAKGRARKDTTGFVVD